MRARTTLLVRLSSPLAFGARTRAARSAFALPYPARAQCRKTWFLPASSAKRKRTSRCASAFGYRRAPRLARTPPTAHLYQPRFAFPTTAKSAFWFALPFTRFHPVHFGWWRFYCWLFTEKGRSAAFPVFCVAFSCWFMIPLPSRGSATGWMRMKNAQRKRAGWFVVGYCWFPGPTTMVPSTTHAAFAPSRSAACHHCFSTYYRALHYIVLPVCCLPVWCSVHVPCYRLSNLWTALLLISSVFTPRSVC